MIPGCGVSDQWYWTVKQYQDFLSFTELLGDFLQGTSMDLNLGPLLHPLPPDLRKEVRALEKVSQRLSKKSAVCCSTVSAWMKEIKRHIKCSCMSELVNPIIVYPLNHNIPACSSADRTSTSNNVCYTAILQYIAVCFLEEAIIGQTGHSALATM